MDYRIAPFGNIWSNGIFNAPVDLVDKYLKIASEYQLKALLFILRNGGQASSAQIARALGQTAGDIDDLLELWTDEGILSADGQAVVVKTEIRPAEPTQTAEKKVVKESLSAPRLTPADIINAQRESSDIAFLLNEAQVILGRTISHAEQEMLVNMVNYYGLKAEVIMMILEFYRSEKKRGKSIGISYVNAMAKNWAEEGIDSVASAEEKLQDIAKSDRLWNEIIAVTGIRHKRPTAKQKEMVKDWFSDFDITMITLAADIMKENIPEPKLSYMNTIIKKWRKNGIYSPSQVKAEQEAYAKSKKEKNDDRLKSEPTYDLSKYDGYLTDNTNI